MHKKRVVVTGLGLVTPLGLDVDSSWQSILSGKSGVVVVPEFQQRQLPTQIAAVVQGFDPSSVIPIKDVKKLDVFIQYGVVAAHQALADSGLLSQLNQVDLTRIGVLIGSGIGGLPFIEKNTLVLEQQGPRKVSPFFISGTIINTLSGYVCIQHGFLGPNFGIASACATGNHSIGQAMRMIQYGDADVMVTGGAEMTVCGTAMAGFSACRALSSRNDDPAHASRPWDKDRDGFVLGEGSGVLVLESYEHAKARGAKIYAELTGFGMSSDAFHLTAPHPEALGARLAMQNTLKDAQINTDQVNYINAHATSTLLGDDIEVSAIKQVFGDRAYQLPVSSTKSMTGHLLGAAGAIEAVFSILALRDQVIPPTINLENPGEGCDLDFVPNNAREAKLRYVLSNSFGFGSTNAALLFSLME